MNTKLKAASVTIALGVAFNFTAVGQAFAVWCSSDAPNVYRNLLTNFMPFVSKLIGGTGLSVEDAVVQSGAAIRGELLKATLATKSVAEGIEAYEQQEALRNRAQDLAEAMQQPATTCQAMSTASSLGSAEQKVQVNVLQSQRQVLSKVSAAGNTNTLSAVDSSYKASNSNFCSTEDQVLGLCTVKSSGQYAGLAGADRDAITLFQSRDGSRSFEGNGAAQAEAAEHYIARVVGGLPPQALQQQGEDYYKRNPQARAYVELSRRYNAMLSVGAYSLNQIKEAHRTQPGLGNDTMLATVSVPGFAPNKADMSMAEAVERFVATKFSPDSVKDLAKATKPNLILRDMAQMNAFSLWMSYQGMQQSQRVEAIQAHQLALIAEQTLRPQLEAQRLAAARSNAQSR
jgi:hypothetical protein